MSDYFTAEQVEQLLRAINPKRVGTDGKGFSHVEAYEIRAHLNRLLGFARWSADLLELALIFEQTDDNKSRWTVCYRATVRLTICAPDGTTLATYTEAATGEAKNQPHRGDAHDLAIKTSESQALKRCAFNFGDQFGLSLFCKGSTAPLVKATLVMPSGGSGEEKDERPSVDSHITEQLPREDETPEPEPDPRETNRPAPAAPAADQEPPEDRTETDTQHRKTEAQRIRQLAMNEPPDDLRAPGRWHAHLMGEAMKAQVLNEKVESLTSTAPVTLKRFLEERMKQYVSDQRRAEAAS